MRQLWLILSSTSHFVQMLDMVSESSLPGFALVAYPSLVTVRQLQMMRRIKCSPKLKVSIKMEVKMDSWKPRIFLCNPKKRTKCEKFFWLMKVQFLSCAIEFWKTKLEKYRKMDLKTSSESCQKKWWLWLSFGLNTFRHMKKYVSDDFFRWASTTGWKKFNKRWNEIKDIKDFFWNLLRSKDSRHPPSPNNQWKSA